MTKITLLYVIYGGVFPNVVTNHVKINSLGLKLGDIIIVL